MEITTQAFSILNVYDPSKFLKSIPLKMPPQSTVTSTLYRVFFALKIGITFLFFDIVLQQPFCGKSPEKDKTFCSLLLLFCCSPTTGQFCGFGLAVSCGQAWAGAGPLRLLVHHITKFPIVELVVARLVELFECRLNLGTNEK